MSFVQLPAIIFLFFLMILRAFMMPSQESAHLQRNVECVWMAWKLTYLFLHCLEAHLSHMLKF